MIVTVGGDDHISFVLEPGVVRPGDPVEGVTIMLDAGGGARVGRFRRGSR